MKKTAILAIVLTAILVMIFGGSAIAQIPPTEITEAPTATPTPTLVPKMEEEQEYSAHCHGRETGNDNSCDGHDIRRPWASPTPRPKPTATPRPTATPKPSDDDDDSDDNDDNHNHRDDDDDRNRNRRDPTSPPPSPTLFKAEPGTRLTATGKNDMILTWNSRSGVSHYSIWSGYAGCSSITIKSRRVLGNSITYSDLKCGRAYRFKIVAYGDGKRYTKQGSNAVDITAKTTPCPPRLPEPGWRFSCPFVSRVDPRDENDAIKVFRTRDGEYHTARAAIYRPLAALLIAAFGHNPDKPSRPTPIQWCAFASVESASTVKVDTTPHGKYYHGNTRSLGTVPHSGFKTGDSGEPCKRKTQYKWESDSQ